MLRLLDFARHSLTAITRACESSQEAAADTSDPYARQRSLRLAQLEAEGKCVARSGKHGNLRYWPAERGSRVLHEHRQLHQRAAA